MHWNLAPAEGQRLDAIVEKPPELNGGRHLFRVGDSLETVYAVRAGAFKTYAYDAGGGECVLGFSLPGELLGFDGVYSRRHGCSAVALTNSSVCALPYPDMAALMGSIARLREQILRLASRDFGNHVFDARSSADQRLAQFLIDLAGRSGGGGVAAEFELPMTPFDVASYLRLDADTLSGTFARFRRMRLVAIDGQVVHLPDPVRLRRIARAPDGNMQ